MICDPFDSVPVLGRRGYMCKPCGRKNLLRDDFYTHKDGRRYKQCKRCISVQNNARKRRGDKPLLTGGISYKKALPPEQWGTMAHFLGSLMHCADVAGRAGVEPDVMRFIREYRKRGGGQG